jgi:hypothetical protein
MDGENLIILDENIKQGELFLMNEQTFMSGSSHWAIARAEYIRCYMQISENEILFPSIRISTYKRLWRSPKNQEKSIVLGKNIEHIAIFLMS